MIRGHQTALTLQWLVFGVAVRRDPCTSIKVVSTSRGRQAHRSPCDTPRRRRTRRWRSSCGSATSMLRMSFMIVCWLASLPRTAHWTEAAAACGTGEVGDTLQSMVWSAYRPLDLPAAGGTYGRSYSATALSADFQHPLALRGRLARRQRQRRTSRAARASPCRGTNLRNGRSASGWSSVDNETAAADCGVEGAEWT